MQANPFPCWLTALGPGQQSAGAEHQFATSRLAGFFKSLFTLVSEQVDPSRLTAPSPGKLVRYTIPDGGSAAADQPYAEVEV